MKAIYRLYCVIDSMKIFNHQLPLDLCKNICDFALNQILNVDFKKAPVTMWSNFGWPQHIVKDSTAVLIFLTPRQFLEEIQSCLEELAIFNAEVDLPFINESNPDLCSLCLTYVWTRNSYIPVHRDGKHRKTVTIYCNEKWTPEMGGVLQWFDSEKNAWDELVPSCGTIVFNDKDEAHATTPVLAHNDFRISLQIFILSSGQAGSIQY